MTRKPIEPRIVKSARDIDWIDASNRRRIGQDFIAVKPTREVIRGIAAGLLIEKPNQPAFSAAMSALTKAPAAEPPVSIDDPKVIAKDGNTDAERPRQSKSESKSKDTETLANKEA